MNISLITDEFGDILVDVSAAGFSGSVAYRDDRVALLGDCSANPLAPECLPVLLAALTTLHAAIGAIPE